jgi:hypothetical protein
MPTIISGDGTITGLTSTGISAVQDLPATASLTTLGVTGNLSFNSGYGSSAVAYGCRAWVNFNGRDTVAIRASGNVSSITDNGTGDYTINFTTAMPDANYCAVASASASDVNSALCEFSNRAITTSGIEVATRNFSATRIDPFEVFVAIFR